MKGNVPVIASLFALLLPQNLLFKTFAYKLFYCKIYIFNTSKFLERAVSSGLSTTMQSYTILFINLGNKHLLFFIRSILEENAPLLKTIFVIPGASHFV